MGNNMDRRTFLGGVLATGAVASVGLATGCSSREAKSDGESTIKTTSSTSGGATSDKAWKFPATEYTKNDAAVAKSCDIVVIGAGAAGTCAALRAAELGKEVIWVERHSSTGGSAQFSEGIFGVGTNFQEAAGVELTVQDIFETTMEYSHYRARPEIVRNFANKSTFTVNWFEEHGVVFHSVLSVVATNPDSFRTWHLYEGFGTQAFSTLADEALKNGADLMLDTTALNLMMDGGNCVGIICENDEDGLIAIDAKAVVICTGGYSENDEMKKEFLSDRWEVDNLVSIGLPTHNGEGINMCVAAGAKPYNVGVINTHTAWNTEITMASPLFAVQQEPLLWVNAEGKRFVNERGVCVDPAYQGNAHSYQPGMLARTIVDQDTIDSLRGGLPFPLGAFWPAGSALTDIDEALEEGIEMGVIFKSDSIEDLGQQLGMEPEVLDETVATYNKWCDAGYDEDFFKESDMLWPIKQAPFYAAVTDSYSFTSTIGGILINGNAQALNEDEKPIPGLYVCGSDASGLYGDSYEFVLSGSTIGFASTTGILAVEHAIDNLL